MGVYFSLSTYLIIWWLVFFLVLPWGVKKPEESALISGQEPGAPDRPQMLKKVLLTTILAGVLFAIFYYLIENGLLFSRDTFN